MRKTVLIWGLLLSAVSILAVAQYGTAPNGNFPASYNGDTFTGSVTAADADSVTLTYTKGSKTETFIGNLQGGCSVPTSDKSEHKMQASDIPQGTVMTAYFSRATKKVNGEKVKENDVIAISFKVWKGQQIPDEQKKIWPCGAQQQ